MSDAGFYNILEACRYSYDNGAAGGEHLVYASSSSVSGSNKKVPYSTDDKVDNLVSLPYTDLPVAQIWSILGLRIHFAKERLFRFSITVTESVTLHMWMTL